MAGYRVQVSYADTDTSEPLHRIEDLADLIALEQLTHELNPVEPAAYTVTFHVTASDRRTVAAGHFYVRATARVAPAGGSANSPS